MKIFASMHWDAGYRWKPPRLSDCPCGAYPRVSGMVFFTENNGDFKFTEGTLTFSTALGDSVDSSPCPSSSRRYHPGVIPRGQLDRKATR